MNARGAGSTNQNPLRHAWHMGRGQGGTIPGSRRQAQRRQARAAEGGEQAAQGEQGREVGVHVVRVLVSRRERGRLGVAIPAGMKRRGRESEIER